jgi:hypothetical protein
MWSDPVWSWNMKCLLIAIGMTVGPLVLVLYFLT